MKSAPSWAGFSTAMRRRPSPVTGACQGWEKSPSGLGPLGFFTPTIIQLKLSPIHSEACSKASEKALRMALASRGEISNTGSQ